MNEEKQLKWRMRGCRIKKYEALDKADSYEILPYGESFWLFSYTQEDIYKVESKVLCRHPIKCLTIEEAAHLAQCYADDANGIKPPPLTFDELCDCM